MAREQILSQLVNGIIHLNKEEYLNFNQYEQINYSPEYINDFEDFYCKKKLNSDLNMNDQNDPDYNNSEKEFCIYMLIKYRSIGENLSEANGLFQAGDYFDRLLQ